MDRESLLHLLKLAEEIACLSRLLNLPRVDSIAQLIMLECVERLYEVPHDGHVASPQEEHCGPSRAAIASSLRIVDAGAPLAHA